MNSLPPSVTRNDPMVVRYPKEYRSPDGVQKAIAIANDIKCCVPSTPVQFVPPSALGVPTRMSATQKAYFRQAILIAPDTNLQDVNVGMSGAPASQPIHISPGGTYVLEPVNGEKWDFYDFYTVINDASDGLYVIYS